MNSYQEKLIFRKMLKKVVATIDTEEQRHIFLNKVFNIDISKIRLPKYLSTITKQDLIQLKKIGVDIQNHGWTHKQLKGACVTEIHKEIFLGQNWLEKVLDTSTRFYAVPFGEIIPPKELNTSIYDYWFTAEKLWNNGIINNKIYNRIAFKIKEL